MQELSKKDATLASYATKDKDAIYLKENSYDKRTPFFRDADKIIYSLAYTRYINKTQVYSNEINDNISKRMTHVQMVARIARTIGRALDLNEDLIEAAALGHDIGHTPFGHAGESILNGISQEVGEGFFNHNVQSVRNLMIVENHGEGLNISVQVLDAILCHNGELELSKYEPKKKEVSDFLKEYLGTYTTPGLNESLLPMTLEGCVIRISDILAYLGRDVEDAIRLGKLSRTDLPKEITQVLGDTNSSIIDTFVTDVINQSKGKDYITMSNPCFKALQALKKFNYEHIYLKANSKEQLDTWKIMFHTLFNHYKEALINKDETCSIYHDFYKEMNKEYQEKTSLNRVVIDYLAGMTDNFFLREYNALERFDN